MNCPKCGKEIPEGAAFCAGCGAPKPEPEVPTAAKEAQATTPVKKKPPKEKPAAEELPKEEGVTWHKGTLLFWMTVFFGFANVHHFLLAKTGGPFNKNSRFVLDWEGFATLAFAMLGLSLVYITGIAMIGIIFVMILSIAGIVHQWRQAFGKIYNYDHTLHYMGQKWKKVICIVEASLFVVSLILVIILATMLPKMQAKSQLSAMPVAIGTWTHLQEAYVAETGKTGSFTKIGYTPLESVDFSFFDIPSGKRTDIRGIGAMLSHPMHKCPENATFVTTIQADPRNYNAKKFCWLGLWEPASESYREFTGKEAENCLSLVPSFMNLCNGQIVGSREELFPAPLFEPLDMSEISAFMQKARENEPQTETGDGFYASTGVAKTSKIMAAFAPNAQKIDEKTYQTENFIFKETARNNRKNFVVWTATSLRPIDACPQGSEWKITATQKSNGGFAVDYGYYVKSPQDCPKVKDMKGTVLQEW